MTNFYYLDLSLKFAESYDEEVTPVYFKKNIIEALNELFGEVGAAVTVDLLKYNPTHNRGILRVPNSHYVKLRSSLTLADRHEGRQPSTSTLKIMSHCRKVGPNNKDILIFATKEDHQVPSKIKLPEPDPQPGLILPNGDINWNCPCLGGMATGPCGVEFRNAFSCFHYSESEPKGSDCYDLFKGMQTCMQQYPTLYNKDLADDDDLNSMSQVEVNSKDDKSEPQPPAPSK